MKRNTDNGIKRETLLRGVSFLLISAALVFFLMWAIERIVEGNIYFRLLTLAPKKSESTQLVLTETEKKKLEENNQGDSFVVSADFPPITLGEQWATITIESAEVDAVPVLHGDYDENLWLGVGHDANSRFPGQGGKVIIAGHVGISKFFQRLETMSVGDLVTLNTIYGDYVYRVSETKIFNENDPSLLMPEEADNGDRLICYTCYPYHTTTVRTQRFAIICDLVSGKDWTVRASNDS